MNRMKDKLFLFLFYLVLMFSCQSGNLVKNSFYMSRKQFNKKILLKKGKLEIINDSIGSLTVITNDNKIFYQQFIYNIRKTNDTTITILKISKSCKLSEPLLSINDSIFLSKKRAIIVSKNSIVRYLYLTKKY